MKRTLLLCVIIISTAFIMGGCANQTTPVANSAQERANARASLVDPGSVAGISSSGIGRTSLNPRTIP